MATIGLPRDFRDFLSLLNWVSRTDNNARKLASVLEEFGFQDIALASQAFTMADQVIRMGVPPLRIELLTSISGVEFDACYAERIENVIDDVRVNVLSLADLKRNKLAAGRPRDLADLAELP